MFKNTKVSGSNDNGLLPVITRNTLLATCIIIAAIIAIVIWTIASATGTYLDGYMTLIRYCSEFGFGFDIYTNFISITMTYSVFENHYYKLCKQIDDHFKSCCLKLVGNDQLQIKTNIENAVVRVHSDCNSI